LVAGKHIFGDTGGRIVGALICIGLVSSISAMTWIGPRVTMAMGHDHALLARLARTRRDGVPAIALLLQLTVVTLLLMTQSFEAVLDVIQFSLTLCSFLAVLGVIVLRFTEPGLSRPYRTWGYPVTPFVFLAVTAFMMYHLIIERPWQSFAGLGIMLTGLAIYGFSQLRLGRGEAFDRTLHG
jgi:APA family basic amino acid/polyamine antiporter